MKDFLRAKRIELKLTQAELAEKVGVDRSMISKLESGGGCSLDLALKLSRALGVSMDELLSSNNNETSATRDSA